MPKRRQSDIIPFMCERGMSWEMGVSTDCLGIPQDPKHFRDMVRPALGVIKFVEAHAANGSVATIKKRIERINDLGIGEVKHLHGRTGRRKFEPEIMIGSTLILDTQTGLSAFKNIGYLVHTPEAERQREIICRPREEAVYIENHSDGGDELEKAICFVNEGRNIGLSNLYVMLDSSHLFTKNELRSGHYLRAWNEGGIKERILIAVSAKDEFGKPIVGGIHLHIGRKSDDAFHPNNPETMEIIKDHKEIMCSSHAQILVWERQIPGHAVMGINSRMIKESQVEVEKVFDMFVLNGLV